MIEVIKRRTGKKKYNKKILIVSTFKCNDLMERYEEVLVELSESGMLWFRFF